MKLIKVGIVLMILLTFTVCRKTKSRTQVENEAEKKAEEQINADNQATGLIDGLKAEFEKYKLKVTDEKTKQKIEELYNQITGSIKASAVSGYETLKTHVSELNDIANENKTYNQVKEFLEVKKQQIINSEAYKAGTQLAHYLKDKLKDAYNNIKNLITNKENQEKAKKILNEASAKAGEIYENGKTQGAEIAKKIWKATKEAFENPSEYQLVDKKKFLY